MINVYLPNETNFKDNGLKILKPLKAIIRKEDNKDFYISLKDTIENKEYYSSGNIIRTNTPWGKQNFRISGINVRKKYIEIKAWHIFYDSKNYIISDSYVVDMNANSALDHLNHATDVKSPFTTISDVNTIRNFRCVRKTLKDAVFEVLNRWGGHLVRDNNSIEIRQNIGQDRNVVFSYGKNIKDIEIRENWDKTVTKLMPVGKDGILLNDLQMGNWLYSYDPNNPSTNPYDIPYTKVIKFGQTNINQENFKKEDGKIDENAYREALISDLHDKALKHLNENSVPGLQYTVDAYMMPESIFDVGDKIIVKHPKCKIDVETSVNALEFDAISGKIQKAEFGNFRETIKNFFSDAEKIAAETAENSIEETTASLSKELKEATNKILEVMDNSYVIYDGDKILIVDKLPKEEANNVIRINKEGIGFSKNGINGNFSSAWLIDGTFDAQKINVINLTADLIRGGTLKLGGINNTFGLFELYDNDNDLISQMNKDGLKVNKDDGSYVKLNAVDGLKGFTAQNDGIYWANESEFHMKKGSADESIMIAGILKFFAVNEGGHKGVAVVVAE